MAAVRTINWPATVAAVQAVLDGNSPRPTQAMIDSGVIARNAVSEVGGVFYDKLANDGILNDSAYAISVQEWAAVAAPAWVETDRVCRAIYKLIPPPTNYMLAAFGMPGVTPWQKNTQYNAGTGAVVPSPGTGFSYLQSAFAGTTGTVQPTFPTVLGATVVDSSSLWTCAAQIMGPSGGQPVPIPWDITLQTYVSLTARFFAAGFAAVPNPGLASLLSSTGALLTNALLLQPAPNPAADSVSLGVTSSLNVAIANANAWIASAAIQ